MRYIAADSTMMHEGRISGNEHWLTHHLIAAAHIQLDIQPRYISSINPALCNVCLVHKNRMQVHNNRANKTIESSRIMKYSNSSILFTQAQRARKAICIEIAFNH